MIQIKVIMYHCSISSFSSLHCTDFASLTTDVAYMTSTVSAIQSIKAPMPLPTNEYIFGSLVQYTDNKTIMLRSMKKMPYIRNNMPAQKSFELHSLVVPPLPSKKPPIKITTIRSIAVTSPKSRSKSSRSPFSRLTTYSSSGGISGKAGS